ncbi:hypothetical protein HMPREF1544_00701 [Mucor circinelloides 1006PhL]|uniref:Uncharacterized protein n=1 Tax=Mucor circinelloides f. circinelloides (strain 1006PhL) TaxID=1220926 RepID=S2KAE4_MUCC1|nr:hypothetical protein HMPREF1544_00701 [Mucor circinelloides 1006PhL]
MDSTLLEPSNILLAGVCTVAPPLLISGALAVAGFTAGGVASGSLAAAWMSSIGNVPAGSLYAALQSTGAIGLTGIALSPTVIAFESATFLSALYGMERYSIGASNITSFGSNASAFMWDAQKSIVKYAQEYTAHHPDAAEKIRRYFSSTKAQMLPKVIDFASKRSKEAIDALDKNTRIHRDNFMKSTTSLISSLNSQENVDLIHKHTKEAAEKARYYTENAVNAANSYLSTINTQENVDFINKKSKEALDALDENTRIHRENLMKAANSYLTAINYKEPFAFLRKKSTE